MDASHGILPPPINIKYWKNSTFDWSNSFISLQELCLGGLTISLNPYINSNPNFNATLGDCDLKESCVEVLCHAFSKLRSLKNLDLQDNPFGEKGVKNLAMCLERCHVSVNQGSTTSDLSDGMSELRPMKLRSLNLSKMKLNVTPKIPAALKACNCPPPYLEPNPDPDPDPDPDPNRGLI